MKGALTPGFVLHHRPWRETSRILEVFTREHGRVSVFARSVRGSKGRLGALLQPFREILFGFSGRGEAWNLVRAEPAVPGATAGDSLTVQGLPSGALMPAWYASELLLKLTTRHDPHPALYDAYVACLRELGTERADARAVSVALRRFERGLLEELGYGLALTHEAVGGEPVEAGATYRYLRGGGLVREEASVPIDAGSLRVSGASLLGLAAGRFESGLVLEEARAVLRAALEELLEGRELESRAVARSVARMQKRKSK